MTQLQSLLGETGARWALWAGIGIAGLLLLILLFLLLRRVFSPAFNMTSGADRRGRPPRLGVTDFFNLDRQGRRLVIIRRDNVEHLVLIGGPNDVLIETNIVRAVRPEIAVVEPSSRPTIQPRQIEPSLEPAPASPQPPQPVRIAAAALKPSPPAPVPAASAPQPVVAPSPAELGQRRAPQPAEIPASPAEPAAAEKPPRSAAPSVLPRVFDTAASLMRRVNRTGEPAEPPKPAPTQSVNQDRASEERAPDPAPPRAAATPGALELRAQREDAAAPRLRSSFERSKAETALKPELAPLKPPPEAPVAETADLGLPPAENRFPSSLKSVSAERSSPPIPGQPAGGADEPTDPAKSAARLEPSRDSGPTPEARRATATSLDDVTRRLEDALRRSIPSTPRSSAPLPTRTMPPRPVKTMPSELPAEQKPKEEGADTAAELDLEQEMARLLGRVPGGGS